MVQCYGLLKILYLGTLRPDLIESASELASSTADAIKTHHNDTELVRELRKQVGWNQQYPHETDKGLHTIQCDSNQEMY